MQPLIKIEHRDGFTVAQVLTETIETENIAEFRRAIEPLVETPAHLVLDLSLVGFMDSTGLGALLSCLRRITSRGGTLRLAGLTPGVRKLFDMVKMDRVFDILPTADDLARATPPSR
ncbi:MAG TPA: STAS domain-containing protein [Fimbriimonas sp.]